MTNNSSFITNVVIFLTSFLHVSNISNYVLSLRLGYVQWHFWAASMLLCLLLVVLSGNALTLRKGTLPYVFWVGVFVGACVLSLFLVDSGDVAMQGFISYGWFFAISIVFVLIVRNPSGIKACGFGIVAAVLVLAGLSIMEFLDPNFQVIVDRYFEDKTKVGEVGRVGAFYENSNDNGIAMVLGMFVGQFFLPIRLRLIFFIFVGVAVLGTVSRTSISIWGAMVVLSLLFGYGSKTRVVGFAGLAFVVFLSYLLVSGQVPGLMADMGAEDLLSKNMTERLSENFFTQEDGSTQVRIQIAQESWQLFLDNPLSGIGIGASDSIGSYDLGTHNQHLKIATEMGIFGLLAYAAIIVVAIGSGSLVAILFLLFYAAIGFTNHGMMTYTVFAVLIPTAVILIPELHRDESRGGNTRRKRRRRKRKSLSHAERELSA